MQIIMKTTMAGPSGVALPGQSIDVPDDVGAQIVKGGYAVMAVEASPVFIAQVETAAIDQPETAALPKAKNRKGAK